VLSNLQRQWVSPEFPEKASGQVILQESSEVLDCCTQTASIFSLAQVSGSKTDAVGIEVLSRALEIDRSVMRAVRQQLQAYSGSACYAAVGLRALLSL
jgi:hypothetical protein